MRHGDRTPVRDKFGTLVALARPQSRAAESEELASRHEASSTCHVLVPSGRLCSQRLTSSLTSAESAWKDPAAVGRMRMHSLWEMES